MDNTYPPSGADDPRSSRPTDQFWTSAAAPSGHGPHDPAGPSPRPSYLEQHHTRDRRHALRWSVGVGLAVVLAAGGVIGGVALASHTPTSGFSTASDNSAAHSKAAQPQSQAAALSAVLNAAGAPTLVLTSSPSATPSASSSAHKPAKAQIQACRKAVAALRAARRSHHPALVKAARVAAIAHCRGLRRLRLLRLVLRGIDGQFTIHTKQGLRTLAFERGVIESVNGHAIVVRAVDGRTETWDLVGSTVIREHGKKTSAHALTRGEPVWVGGPVISGANDARLIVIHPPTASSTAGPAQSASGS